MGISRNIKYYFRKIKKVERLKKAHKKVVVNPELKTNDKELIFNFSNQPKVSIIIPFYNQINFTINCLHFLSKHLSEKNPYEIILIDDNSTEPYDFSHISNLKIIRNSENLGFLRNVNKGIHFAKGEYIYLLNNDTEVHEGFLDELFYVFENFDNVGAVGSMLINPNCTLQEAGCVFLKDFNITQVVRRKKVYYPEVNYIYKVDYCSGCSLLFKKYNDSGELNLLDEQFVPAYFEETDLCFNFKYNQRKDIYYTPFSKVLHYNGITYNSKNNVAKVSETKEQIFKVNAEKFKQKWNNEISNIQAESDTDRIIELYGNKSILFFCGLIPEYDRDSGSNRLKEIMMSYIELGYHVTLVMKYNFISNLYVEYYQRLGINVYYEHYSFKGFEKYLKRFQSHPTISWFYGPQVFDKYCNTVKKILPNSKIVYDMVDIHHVRFKRAIDLEPKNIGLRLNYIKYKKIELKAAEKSDVVITISDAEKQYMTQLCDASKLMTISNVHYTKIDINQTLSYKSRNGILFIGSRHPPNIDAVTFLYNEIMPLVWKAIPEMKVFIIGNVNAYVGQINHPNFIFKGYVKDIEEYLNSVKIMVAPLRYGAGVKGKIGQAFEYFLPVVTSSIGAEGMQLENRKNALIEDSPEGFANAIVELCQNEQLWHKLQNHSEESLQPFSKELLKSQLQQIF